MSKTKQNDNTCTLEFRYILNMYVYSLDGYNDFCTNKCFELVKSYLEAQCDKKSFLQILLLQRELLLHTQRKIRENVERMTIRKCNIISNNKKHEMLLSEPFTV